MPRSARLRKWLRRAAIAAGALIGAAALALVGLLLFTPSVGDAMALARAQATAHHEPFPGPPVPARFADALIATEDHRFGSEPGVDPFAIGRVLLSGLTDGGDQGGATLYQQLAKLLYTPGRGGFGAEVEQVALAIKLRYSYSGPQILRMYSVVVYFGNGFYGLAQASCGYFGIEPERMSWPQAALLAGLVQAPSDYDPLQDPTLARSRESHVISRLVATGVLTQRQGTAAIAVPISSLVAGASSAGASSAGASSAGTGSSCAR